MADERQAELRASRVHRQARMDDSVAAREEAHGVVGRLGVQGVRYKSGALAINEGKARMDDSVAAKGRKEQQVSTKFRVQAGQDGSQRQASGGQSNIGGCTGGQQQGVQHEGSGWEGGGLEWIRMIGWMGLRRSGTKGECRRELADLYCGIGRYSGSTRYLQTTSSTPPTAGELGCWWACWQLEQPCTRSTAMHACQQHSGAPCW